MADRSPGLSLRLRLIFAAAGAVAVAVLLAGAGALLTVRHELRYQVDESLVRNAGSAVQQRGLGAIRVRGVYQLLYADGTVEASAGNTLPVTEADREVAAGHAASHRHDARLDGLHVRVLTVGIAGGGAAQLMAPLDAVDATLKHMVVLLAFLVLGGVGLAVALGMLVARAALVPVDRLTAAAERVTATMDLSETIDVRGADEIARLGRTLNALLSTVDQHQQAQRRLVADASHELRTPLTSMRTNLELLARSPDIDATERQAIITDLVAQVAELSALVGQLVDMEREPIGAETRSEVAFDEVVESAVSRARLHSPGLHFVVNLEPTTVLGQAGVLERAVANLLENAAKWSPAGGEIEVQLVGGTLSVRDHGPGIAPADAPHVFERFYRSAQARALPGSGLGLSIVRQAAEDHGGQAWLLPAPGGGTVACLRVPSPPVGGWTEPPPPVLGPRITA
ncbi:MAG: HAMP domain-containing sensor histidine kinase [Acidimicrobiales bacterium]